MNSTATKTPKKSGRKLGKKLLVSFSSLVIGLGLLEVACRIAGYAPSNDYFRWMADKQLQIVPMPNQDTWFCKDDPLTGETRLPVRINKYSQRDADYPLAKGPNELRMIIVGDSLTFGQGVRDDESYTAILGRLYETEPRSPEPHVINAGVNGWSTWHYMRWAETQLDKFQPDVLVVGLFLGNDMVISPPDVKAIPVPLENWTRDSALYSYGVEVYRKYLWKRVQASKRGMSLEELDEELEQYKGVIESDLQPNERKLLWKKNSIPHLATIRKACEEAHVEVVVLMIPSRASLLNEKLATKTVLFHKTLRDMLNAIDLRVIEVAEPLRKAGEAAWLPWDGGHLSPAGNRVVAKVLEVQLDALGLVPLPTAPAGGEL